MILIPIEEISDKKLDQQRNERSKGNFEKIMRYLNEFKETCLPAVWLKVHVKKFRDEACTI